MIVRFGLTRGRMASWTRLIVHTSACWVFHSTWAESSETRIHPKDSLGLWWFPHTEHLYPLAGLHNMLDAILAGLNNIVFVSKIIDLNWRALYWCSSWPDCEEHKQWKRLQYSLPFPPLFVGNVNLYQTYILFVCGRISRSTSEICHSGYIIFGGNWWTVATSLKGICN